MKVSEEVSRVYLGVNCFWVPELLDPCVRDDGKHKLCRLPSRGVIRSAVRAPCLVCRLEACPDDGRIIVVDHEVIGPDPRGFGEGFAVALEVRGLRPDNPDQVVRPARFVVRDLLYQRGNSLPQSCEVGARRMFSDGLEVVKRCRKNSR